MRINLKYHSTENGFCRVYYTDVDDKRRVKRLYCFQEEQRGVFYFGPCSRDGEPEYTKALDDMGYLIIDDVELPKDTNSTDMALRKFLLENKAMFRNLTKGETT